MYPNLHYQSRKCDQIRKSHATDAILTPEMDVYGYSTHFIHRSLTCWYYQNLRGHSELYFQYCQSMFNFLIVRRRSQIPWRTPCYLKEKNARSFIHESPVTLSPHELGEIKNLWRFVCYKNNIFDKKDFFRWYLVWDGIWVESRIWR